MMAAKPPVEREEEVVVVLLAQAVYAAGSIRGDPEMLDYPIRMPPAGARWLIASDREEEPGTTRVS